MVGSLGLVAALFATYWDDSWHTDRGRDDFAIAPHLLLYGGVLAALVAVAAWFTDARRTNGSWRLDRTTDRPLLLALAGAVVAIASAPVDNAWHELFGRDAVLWSPPHLLGVAGTLTLTVGMLAGLRLSEGRAASVARLFVAAGVIGALQIPVLEYDSDVPQFPVAWYLPVAVVGLGFAAVLLDLLTTERWAITKAAALYLALRVAVVGFLSATGFSGTIVAPALVPLALYEALRGRSQTIRLGALAISAPLVWWVAIAAQGDSGTAVSLQAAAATSMILAIAAAIAAGASRAARRSISAAQVVLGSIVVLIALGSIAAPAWAHDPGQGPESTEATMTAARSSGAAAVTVEVPGGCDGLSARRTVARRAGTTVAGTLDQPATNGDPCRFHGKLEGLSDGRWFIYAELLDRDGAELEVWVPAAEATTTTLTRSLYTPPDAPGRRGQVAAGAIIMAIIAALLYLDVSQARLISRSATAANRGNPRPATT